MKIMIKAPRTLHTVHVEQPGSHLLSGQDSEEGDRAGRRELDAGSPDRPLNMAIEDIIVDADTVGLVRITINRAHKHNDLVRLVLDGLAAAVLSAGSDMRTNCIVLRGAGESYFAAGGDFVDLASVRTDVDTIPMADQVTLALDAIRDCPVPVIDYVTGDALGGGAELALACDLRAFAPHARIGYVQARMGNTSAWGGGPDLCALVGPARALRMMSRCEMINAQTAAWRNGLPRQSRREVERSNLLTTWASAEHWSAVERFMDKSRS